MTPEQRVEGLLLACLLDEVRATPKPGLVDLRDSGLHRDMDAETFVASARAVAPLLGDMFACGRRWTHGPQALFGVLRPMGMEAEKAMLAATHGVNTHKGAIFTLGLLAAAAGMEYGAAGAFDSAAILRRSREMCAAPLAAELGEIAGRPPATHGERLFAAGGHTGIRGEAMAGFPALRELALPALRAGGQGGRARLHLHTLLRLMARVEDSTVLHRAGEEGLRWMRGQAEAFLAAYPQLTDQAMEALGALNGAFIAHNVSPGGCADLLAAGIFLHDLEEGAE